MEQVMSTVWDDFEAQASALFISLQFPLGLKSLYTLDNFLPGTFSLSDSDNKLSWLPTSCLVHSFVSSVASSELEFQILTFQRIAVFPFSFLSHSILLCTLLHHDKYPVWANDSQTTTCGSTLFSRLPTLPSSSHTYHFWPSVLKSRLLSMGKPAF